MADSGNFKGVSDPISSNGQVTKASDPSVPDVLKMNGEHPVASETSQKTIENPSNNFQVSSQDNVGAANDSLTLSTELPPEETKQSIRFKVWDLLEKNGHLLFSRVCKGHIPHFDGSPEAADQLATLEDFKKAKTVEVNLDKPQARVRFLALEAGKNLLVPIPRLRSGLFKKIVPPAEDSKEQLKTVTTQQGVLSSGEDLGLDDQVSIDLVVIGAVAVSKEGHRIGKGEGYADLEFALMMKMGAITQDTVVITTVHDEQVFDTLPHHLFKEHDVPVDFIVTPKHIYEVKPRLPKPSGIYWNMLSNRRLQLIPVLKTLQEREIAEGKDCQLKDVDSDPEDRPMRPSKYYRKIQYRRRDQTKGRNPRERPPRESSAPPTTPNARPPQNRRQSRTFRRKPDAPRSNSAKEQPPRNSESRTTKTTTAVNKRKQNIVERVRAGGDGVRAMPRKYLPKPKVHIAFSIRVSGISQGTRVRDLKIALSERGVRPYDITWASRRGHALLHFSRMDMFKDKKPILLSEVPSVDVVEGFPAKLDLKLPGYAKGYKYEWCVNGKPINIAGHYRVISRLDGTVALVINSVNFEDAGEYTVTIRNKHGEITSKGALNVKAKTKADSPDAVPSFGEADDKLYAERGATFLISLTINGNPIPDVEWSKDGSVLSQTDRIQLLCDGSKVVMKVNECRMNDAGSYKCKLTNHLGEAEFTTTVIINAPARNYNNFNNITKIVSVEDITNTMDDIISALQDLKVKGTGEEDPRSSLCVEPANSISRIESTGISAV